MSPSTARDRVSTNTSSNVNRESRSGLWIGTLLVAVALILAVLVALTPHNDTMPMNDTNNAGPTTTQPVQPTPVPKNEP
jgi:hypothetical protein